MDFSLVTGNRGYSLVAVYGLLVAVRGGYSLVMVVSFVAERGL